MPRIVIAAALLAALLAAPPATASAQDTVPGEVLVRFKGNAGGSERAQARRAAKATVKRDLRLSGAQLLRAEPGQTVEDALAALRRHGSVRYAEPNHVVRAAATPDDTHYGHLWGLHNAGQTILGTAGLEDSDMDAPEAWDLITDASAVKVAVVDSGVRWNHPDLAANMWSNAADPAGGGDDDGNGLVDDVRGWDFIDGDSDPTDLNDHGTHVAGTIAAHGDNGAGVAGVAWDAQIMPLRVLGADGYGDAAAILDAFDYAGDMGARVVNASLGAPGNGAFYRDVIEDHPDTLYVVAAGNGGEDGAGDDNEKDPQEPCHVPAANLICVAATDNRDQLAPFSNYGATSVDLAAPGVGTLSTVPEFADSFADDFQVDLTRWTSAGSRGGGWDLFTYGGSKVAGDSPDDQGFTFSGNEDLRLTTAQPVSLAGKENCVLQYDLRYGYSHGKDGLLVETSTDGVKWVSRAEYTGENGYLEELRTDLRADGAPALHLRFRVIADGTGENGKEWFGAVLDDVHVKCESSAAAGGTYAFMGGTSMAAPHVAGVATLLFGARPAATVADVRGWLLGSGDPVAALSGKTVTGRRLNARRSLDAALGVATVETLPAQSPSISGATLRGTIDPNGTPTAYKFVYGTSPDALTSQIPADPVGIGAGHSPVTVAQPLTGLTAEVTYYYRLVAVQGTTEHAGAVQSFRTTTPAAPTAVTGGVTTLTATGATLVAEIDPNGQPTGYRFEYRRAGTSEVVQTAETSAGASDDPVTVTAAIAGLAPDTEYAYRVVIPGGPQGAERTFRTLAAPLEPVAPEPQVPLPPSGPAGTAVEPPPPPAPRTVAPRSARQLVTCRVNRSRRRVACKVLHTATAKATVRITRAGRLLARGSAQPLTAGRAMRMRTLRRVRAGRYRLQVTFVERGVKTVLKATIRL